MLVLICFALLCMGIPCVLPDRWLLAYPMRGNSKNFLEGGTVVVGHAYEPFGQLVDVDGVCNITVVMMHSCSRTLQAT